MNIQEKSQRLNEILENESVMVEISNAETKEIMQEVFSKNGLEMDMSEIDAFIQMMNSEGECEFNEQDLESISGGSVTSLWILQQAAIGIKKVSKACWNAGRWFANKVG